MRKVHISFLGTTNYAPCNYYNEDQPDLSIKDVRFVQEASIKYYCHDFGKDDLVLVFVTDQAKTKNWKDNGHEDKKNQGEMLKIEGLESRLKKLELNCGYKLVRIDNGIDKSEVWSVFQTVLNELMDNDIVVLDITNGFRSLPMLGMVLLNYAKSVLDIKIRSICYGALEELQLEGKSIYKIKLENRNVPILNLKEFSVLQDWGTAANDFKEYGQSKKLESLIVTNTFSDFLDKEPSTDVVDKFKELGKNLNLVTSSINTVRGKSIKKGEIFDNLRKSIKDIKEDNFIAPLSPLLGIITQKVKPFKENDARNGVDAAQWCYDHGLIQQGITILIESIIEIVLIENGMSTTYKKNRNMASSVLAVARNNFKMNGYDPIEVATLYNSRIVSLFNSDGFYKKLNNQYRNDINHGGFNASKRPMGHVHIPKSPEEFKPELNTAIEKTYSILESLTSQPCS